MIFYFTATGNSLDAAYTIAEATNDRIASIGHATKEEAYGFEVEQGEPLGFVFPVYMFSTPRIVDEFLRNVRFITPNGNPFVPGYCYCVVTCAALVGTTPKQFERTLRKYQNIRLDASYSIRNVSSCTYLTGPGSRASQTRKQEEAHRNARTIARSISSMKFGHFEARNPIGSAFSAITGKEGKHFSTDKFLVDPNMCLHCGTCVEMCPTNTIRLDNGYPVWIEGNCTQCLACLQRCPVHAIQFGTSTQHRPRYLHPILQRHQYMNEAIARTLDMQVPEPEAPVYSAFEQSEAQEANRDDAPSPHDDQKEQCEKENLATELGADGAGDTVGIDAKAVE